MGSIRKIAVFTSGGDAPGMNAAVRAVVRSAIFSGLHVDGIYRGFEGMIEGDIEPLSARSVNHILQRGGTVLKSARSKDFKTKAGRAKAFEKLKANGIDAVVGIGGDGTFAGAHLFNKEFDFPFIGIPGTIDNDLVGTDYTIGFDTALNTVVDAVDKIRDTAASHNRLFFVEVMGRHSGFIALDAGIAVGAEESLIPEKKTDLPSLIDYLKRIRGKKRSSIILVSEGDDEGGAIDIMNKVKAQLGDFDIRSSVLGHMQRGGNPSAMDRILASRMGVKAIESLLIGEKDIMLGMQNNSIVSIPIKEAISKKETIDEEKLNVMKILSHF